jgi:putative membrane protein
MHRLTPISLALLAALATPTIAQNNTSSAVSSFPSTAEEIEPAAAVDAQTFVNQAAASNLFEIQSSQLALSNSTSDAIKGFAQHMIDDHSKAGEEMTSVATREGLIVPAELDQPNADKLAQLQGVTGEQFDLLYVQLQTGAHAEAVALFSGYAESGDNEVLKDFASKTLPTLQEHYEEVLTLQQS